MMNDYRLRLSPAGAEDFHYIYGLCEVTMRTYVEQDFGDRFDEMARPAILRLLDKGVFYKIYIDNALVGTVAYEVCSTHIQIEELYIEPVRQRQGIGEIVVSRLMALASSLSLPVRLHVLASNNASNFYKRIGFYVVRNIKEAKYMEYKAENVSARAA